MKTLRPYPHTLALLSSIMGIDVAAESYTRQPQSEAEVNSRLKMRIPAIMGALSDLHELRTLIEKRAGALPEPNLPAMDPQVPVGLDFVVKMTGLRTWAGATLSQILLTNGMGLDAQSPTGEIDARISMYWWDSESSNAHLKDEMPQQFQLHHKSWKAIPRMQQSISALLTRVKEL